MLRVLVLSMAIAATLAASLGNEDLIEKLRQILQKNEELHHGKRGMYSLTYDGANKLEVELRICIRNRKPCPGMAGHELWVYDENSKQLMASKYETYSKNFNNYIYAPIATIDLSSNPLQDGKKYVVMACVKTDKGEYINCNAYKLTGGQNVDDDYRFVNPKNPGFCDVKFALPENAKPSMMEAEMA